MADTLTVRYGPAWTPTDDTELIAAVAERLTPHGGTYLLPPYFADVEDARRMLEHGQLCEHPVTVIAGAPNRCHDCEMLAGSSGRV